MTITQVMCSRKYSISLWSLLQQSISKAAQKENSLKYILTCVIKGREGERVVRQRLEKIRNIAPVSEEELVICRHDELLLNVWKTTTEWETLRVGRRLLSAPLLSLPTNFAAGHITGTPACVQTTCITMSCRSHAPRDVPIGWESSSAQSITTAEPMGKARRRALVEDNHKHQPTAAAHISPHARRHVRPGAGSRPGAGKRPAPPSYLLE